MPGTLSTIVLITLILLLPVAGLAAILVAGLRARARRKTDAETVPAQTDPQHDLDHLPLHQAKTQAEQALKDERNLVPSLAEQPCTDQRVPASIQEFFSRYESVDVKDEEIYVSSEDMAPYEHDPAYMRIGREGPHLHILTRPSDDRVYIFTDQEPMDLQVEEVYPSIYHWLLATEHTTSPPEDTPP